jgi:TonB-dependent SusC/RagA subfamily outer membrane receptor
MNYLSLEKGFRGLCFFIMLFLLLISGLSTEAAVVQSQGKRKLSGNVTTTEFGAPEPLPGVFISTKDMKSGGITDGNGHYEIEIPDDVNVLTFSMVGYKTLELPIKGRQILDVVMQSETIQMNDVVVTALGIKKEAKKLGYAVQTVESKSLSEMPNPSIATTLSGKVAGMTVYNTPNMLQKNSISLRGVADPVIVIDGVPTNTNLYDINPMDIESISVLKGATAAALYGSKGQAGAIQITTKTGKSKTGQPAVSVEFSQRSMFRAGWIVFPETNNQYGNGLNGQYAYFDGKGNGLYDNDWVWGPKLDVEDPSTESGYWETTHGIARGMQMEI